MALVLVCIKINRPVISQDSSLRFKVNPVVLLCPPSTEVRFAYTYENLFNSVNATYYPGIGGDPMIRAGRRDTLIVMKQK